MEIQKTKLDWNKFEPLFGSWATKIKPFFDNGGFDPIYKFLKFESARGKRIAPLSKDVFKAFIETDFNNLKLIIVGLSPYHTFYDGKPVADGLCMSCSITKKLQPSLLNFYNAVETELYNGLNLNYNKNPDLTYLSKEGILLLNYALTTSEHKPGDHCYLWEPFMKFLFEEVISCTGVPVVFLGKEAAKLEKYVCAFTPIFKCSHPASAAYSGSDWDSGGMFKNVNKTLKDANNFKIQWLDVPADEYDEDREIPF
jgi:uracil-DNA glycosylase